MDLIDTPEFQRLRRVRQLGVSNITYPNAEHTRFVHSLGVLHVTNRILAVLERRYQGDEKVAHWLHKARFVRIAALLHDLGHGPFSHMMERAFESGKDHEERSKSMLTDPESGIHQVLVSHNLTANEIEEIRNLLDFHEIPFLHDIISSSLDADRMDYLLRDSLFTGVAYGNYDLEWVINSFCLGLDPSPDVPNTQVRLCLDEKRGRHAAEQLIVARAHMSMQVYFHQTTRLWEAHLLMLFAEAARLAENGELPDTTPTHVKHFLNEKGKVSHREFLLMDEPSFIAAMVLWSQAEDSTDLLWKLAANFLNRKKTLDSRELRGDQPTLAFQSQLKMKLTKELGPEGSSWLIDHSDFAAYKAPAEAMKEKDAETYWETVSRKAILLSDGDYSRPATAIERNSILFQSLGTASFPISRIFFMPEVATQIDRHLS